MVFFRRDIWRYQFRDALIYWFYIPAAVIGSGLLLDLLMGGVRLPSSWLLYSGAAGFVGMGGWLAQRAIIDLARFGDGTPSPHRPPKRLVKQGVYRLCRHPMFLGYDLAALGVALCWRSPCMLLFSVPLLLFFEVRFLKKEEIYLARRYGDTFSRYKEKVPMLLPTFSPGEKE